MANLINGFPFDSGDFADDSDVALVRIRDILASDFETYVPASKVPRSVMIRDGDVVIGMDGDFNSVYWQRGAAALNQRLCLLRANAAADARYLAYTLPTELAKINEVTYSTTVKHLSSEQVRRIKLWAPDVQGQARIADFLDRDTAKIDALIDKQLALVAGLGERKDALWNEMYRAISSDHVMVSRLITSIVDGPFGSALTSAHYADSGVRVIRLGNIGINEFRGSDEAYISEEYGAALSAHGARHGDVVMAGLGDDRMPLGRAAVVPADFGPAIVKADCYRLRPRATVSPEFLAWALSSPPVRTQIANLSRGATRSRLNTGVAKAVRVVFPDRGEQDRILKKWSVEVNEINAAVEEVQRSVALAQERRAALITAAVTGQLDIASGKVA